MRHLFMFSFIRKVEEKLSSEVNDCQECMYIIYEEIVRFSSYKFKTIFLVEVYNPGGPSSMDLGTPEFIFWH